VNFTEFPRVRAPVNNVEWRALQLVANLLVHTDTPGLFRQGAIHLFNEGL
jgi:hypothetical protein